MKKILLLNLFFLTVAGTIYSQTWTNLITGVGTTGSDYVLALTVDSASNELYVGGTFNSVSGQAYQNLVKWDGSNYINIGADGSVTAIAKLNGNIYAGGSYATIGGTAANRMARYNGTSWQPLGAGTNAPAYAFAWYGGLLYAGGSFSGVNGFSTSANHIATWNGITWSPVGGGANNGTTASGCCLSGDVNALCVYNGDLYVGGEFSKAGGVASSCIAKWNGATWSAVGGGINTYVTSLAVYNNELYAGGNFTTAGGVTAHNIARWNGTAWASAGPPAILNNPIWAMEVINGELYVAGSFSGTVTSGISKFVAKWNGSSWSNVTTGSGTDNVSFAIAGAPSGWVYTGGAFFSADGNSNAIHIASLFISTPLPVELISFDAVCREDKSVLLQWQTASETNNDYFSVQRSGNRNGFENIGTVKGTGSNSSGSNYSFIDTHPLNGINYYRLQQTDYNGETTFSKVVVLHNLCDNINDLMIIPNPAHDFIEVFLKDKNEEFEVKIFNTLGEIVKNVQNQTRINITGLASGIYLLKLSAPSQISTVKLVIE